MCFDVKIWREELSKEKEQNEVNDEGAEEQKGRSQNGKGHLKYIKSRYML